jgi:hypothetical protein
MSIKTRRSPKPRYYGFLDVVKDVVGGLPGLLAVGGDIGGSIASAQQFKDLLDFRKEQFEYEKNVVNPFLQQLQIAQLKQQAEQAGTLAAIQKLRTLQDAYQALMSSSLGGGQLTSGALTNLASLGQAPLLRR